MKDLPPEPAFAHWCAQQLNPPALCERLHPTTPLGWSLEFWGLLIVFLLMFAGLIVYFVWFQRRAYLGGRYCQAFGGYRQAAAHLDTIEAVNEARLHVGMHARFPDRVPR